MKRISALSQAEREALLEQAIHIRRTEGLFGREIADRLGVNSHSLSSWMCRIGVKLQQVRYVKRPNPRRTALVAEAIRLRREEQLTRRRIAERLGVRDVVLARQLVYAGISLREIGPERRGPATCAKERIVVTNVMVRNWLRVRGDGMSYDRMGKLWNCSATTVRRHVERAQAEMIGKVAA